MQCAYFPRGKCINGDNCRFAHGDKPGRQVECQYYRTDSCRKGDSCNFAHTEHESHEKYKAINKIKAEEYAKQRIIDEERHAFKMYEMQYFVHEIIKVIMINVESEIFVSLIDKNDDVFPYWITSSNEDFVLMYKNGKYTFDEDEIIENSYKNKKFAIIKNGITFNFDFQPLAINKDKIYNYRAPDCSILKIEVEDDKKRPDFSEFFAHMKNKLSPFICVDNSNEVILSGNKFNVNEVFKKMYEKSRFLIVLYGDYFIFECLEDKINVKLAICREQVPDIEVKECYMCNYRGAVEIEFNCLTFEDSNVNTSKRLPNYWVRSKDMVFVYKNAIYTFNRVQLLHAFHEKDNTDRQNKIENQSESESESESESDSHSGRETYKVKIVKNGIKFYFEYDPGVSSCDSVEDSDGDWHCGHVPQSLHIKAKRVYN